jgi:hypothetical protein
VGGRACGLLAAGRTRACASPASTGRARLNLRPSANGPADPQCVPHHAWAAAARPEEAAQRAARLLLRELCRDFRRQVIALTNGRAADSSVFMAEHCLGGEASGGTGGGNDDSDGSDSDGSA